MMNDDLIHRIITNTDDEEDNDDDAFLPPGFIPGETPQLLMVVEDDLPLLSPPTSPPPPTNYSKNQMKSPFTNTTGSNSRSSSRKEFLRRSISALDDINEDFVDLLGLRITQKENETNQVDSFWLQQPGTENQFILTNHCIGTTTCAHEENTLTDMNQTNDAMDISYFHTTSPNNGINSRLDELAADLEADVVAGNLFLQTINTPLLVKKCPTHSDTDCTNKSTDNQLQKSQSKQLTEYSMESKMLQLQADLDEMRHVATVQTERATQLDIELQQLALSTASEQHIMQEQYRKYAKEMEYITSQWAEAKQQTVDSNAEQARLINERDTLSSDLSIVAEQMAKLTHERDVEKSQMDDLESRWTERFNAVQQSLSNTVEECRELTIQRERDLEQISTLTTTIMETKNCLDRSVVSGNETDEQLRITKKYSDELQTELSQSHTLQQSKEDLIVTQISAIDHGNALNLQLSNELQEAKGRIEDLLTERDTTNSLLCQLRNDKSELYHQIQTMEDNLQKAMIEKTNRTLSNEDLLEQLRQAEDLALLVATDKDVLQERFDILQRELQIYQLDKVTLVTAIEEQIVEKDRKIRSLQRLLGAMQSLADDDNTGTVHQSSIVRRLQRRGGFLKDEYEQRITDITNMKDAEILKLQTDVTELEQMTQDQKLEWKSMLNTQTAQASEDKAKIRNLKRRIGATESLLHDEVNESTLQQDENNGKIRSLQRRIGGLADEIRSLKQNQSSYCDQLKMNEQLQEKLSIAEHSVTELQSKINLLQEDLQDAYEQEDHMQEDFVTAMKHATTEVEKLHATYTLVVKHLKDQYKLVEEELFDALEREDEQKDEQIRVVTEHNLKMSNFREHINERLIEAAECSELLREQCVMSTVDMFQQCSRYFRHTHDEHITSIKTEHAFHLDEQKGKHIADMVGLFRTTIRAENDRLLDKNAMDPIDLSKTISKYHHITSPTDSAVSSKNLLATETSVDCDIHQRAATESSTNSNVDVVIQSPRSAFVSYAVAAANKNACIKSKSEQCSTEAQPTTAISNVSVSIADPIPEAGIGAALKSDVQDESHIKTQLVALQSPTMMKSSIRKSLHFTPPHKELCSTIEKEIDSLRSFHSTPKISAVKAKLRSIEMSRLPLNRNFNGTADRLKINTESNDRVSVKWSSARGRPTSSVSVPSSKLIQSLPQVGSSTNSVARQIGKLTTETKARPVSNATIKRTLKPKLDTGLKPKLGTGLVKPNITNKLGAKRSHNVAKFIPITTKPTTAPSGRGNALIASKPKSRLPQFASSRVLNSSNINLQNKSHVKTVSALANDASNTDLFQKLSDLKTTQSTPLAARSARSDEILSRSESTKKLSTKIPGFDRLIATPQSQPQSTRVMSKIKECHFTPIRIGNDVFDASSPVTPLLTPKSESPCEAVNIDSEARCSVAATRIQSNIRGNLARCIFEERKKQVNAAKIIQKKLRQFVSSAKDRTATQRSKAASTLQQFFQALRKEKDLRKAQQRSSQSVMLIQRVWRGYNDRNKLTLSRKSIAATVLQSFWRTVSARKYFRRILRGVSALQTSSRAWLVHKQIKKEICLRLADTATVIQRCYRMFHCRSKFSASKFSVVKIQRCFRCAKERMIANEKKSMLQSAVCIQAFYRRRLAMEEFVMTKVSIVIIQKYVRSQIERRKAAICIQSKWRWFEVRRQFRAKIVSVVSIQSLFRGYRALLLATFVRKSKAALRIQSFFRMTSIQRQYCSLVFASILIQTQVRGYFARLEHCLQQKKIVVVTSLQSQWRRFMCRRRFITSRSSIMKIQHVVRAYMHFRQVQKNSKSLTAAVRIQKAWGLFSHKKKITAVICLQTQWRVIQCRRRFKTMLCFVVKIQKFVRGFMHRSEIEKRTTSLTAAMKIQKLWGLFYSQKKNSAAISFQSQWRKIMCQRRYKTKLCSVVKIQKAVRGFMNLCKVEKRATSVTAAVKIQMVWRLFSDRKKITVKKLAILKDDQNILQEDCQFFKSVPLRSLTVSSKKGKRVALGNLDSSVLKVAKRHGGNHEAVLIGTSTENKHSENQPSRNIRFNNENARPERNGKTTCSRTALAAESLSVALKRANEETFLPCSGSDKKFTLEEIEKLKVVDLRHELKSYGIESKNYSKLRKTELVAMVFDRRTSQSQS